jgi:3-phenylpropionate/trans-cinnamate dioxygenase ferredoxin reductase subunit
MDKIVIIGAGHAGVELAHALRQRIFEGSITLISDEDDLPYHKPPLSKDFLKSDGGDPLPLKAASFYPQHDIQLRLGLRAIAVDRRERRVALQNGEELAYDHLVLALGARNRRLDIPGADHPQILELRTLPHARTILARLPQLHSAIIVGGGFIGLEVAALLREKGIVVNIVEMADCLMGRVVSGQVSQHFRHYHQTLGSRIHFGTRLVSIEHRGSRTSAHLSNGDLLVADAILIATGIVPNSELAAAAGLSDDNGIIVDDRLLTCDPAISAIGDCAAFPDGADALMRLESVPNAVGQARYLARRLTGDTDTYRGLPWFWSNQGTERLQIAGLCRGADTAVIRGDPMSGQFSVFLYRGESLLAVESVNSPRDHMLARRLIEKSVAVSPEIVNCPDAELKRLFDQ